MNTGQLQEKYTSTAESFRNQAAREEKFLLFVSFLRLGSFIGGFIISWLGFNYSIFAGILLFTISAAIFLYLLKLYSGHSQKRDFLANLSVINANEAKAISGDYSPFDGGSQYLNTNHDFSYDIDLFGTSSLFQYLNRTVTGYGRDVLAGWLSDPYPLASQLSDRQEAIRELATKESWRHDFMAAVMGKSFGRTDIEGLLAWMQEPDYIRSSVRKKFLIFAFPSVAILSLICVISGILTYPVFIFFFLLNLMYVAAGIKEINRIHNGLSRKYIYLSSMNELINVFENGSFNSKVLNGIKIIFSGENVSAAASVKKLGRLIQAFDSRLNLLISFALNGLLLWDYHNVLRLEKWKSEYKDLFALWLDMTGQADAFVSLGNYAANNATFVYPEVSGDVAFDARNLGHQLIEERLRVCNDFSLKRNGAICIISGANMAGKSTFLRTVAVNYILGMAGAPVCASGMKFLPVRLFTSMRTTDSLMNNESYFYAELKRLKLLKVRIENGESILFILDEILKGTNSADKSMGSKLFLKKLAELNATGLIATHDTSLGEMEREFPAGVLNKCFEIEIDGDRIKFDYILRDGITRKMNAALLMKQMGILG